MSILKRTAGTESVHRQLSRMILFFLVILMLSQYLIVVMFSGLTRERTIHYSEEKVRQISVQIDSILESIWEATYNIVFNEKIQEYLTTENQARKYVDLYPIVKNLLANTCASNENLYDIMLFNNDMRLAASCQQPHSMDVFQKIKLFDSLNGYIEPTGFPAIVHGTSVYYPIVQNVYGISSKTSVLSKLGTCVVLCKTNGMQNLVRGASIVDDARLYITDTEGVVVVSNRASDVCTVLDSRYLVQTENTEIKMENGRKAIVQHADANGFDVYSVIAVRSLLSDMYRIMARALMLSVVACVVLLLIGGMIRKRINRAVLLMVEFMKNVADGSNGRRIRETLPEEIQAIAQGTNQMLDQLESARETMLRTQSELYEARILAQQSQLTALQRQINPHFLFNTLNCIASICAVRNVPEAVRVSEAMAQIFHYCIKGEDMATVREELECVKDYIEILEIRFHGRIRGRIETDDACVEERIPKMILQPIVENAAFHGLEPKYGGGEIFIRVCGKRDEICFEISDNGVGMDESVLFALQEQIDHVWEEGEPEMRKSIGVVNIAARLRLLFKGNAVFRVESRLGEGTRFTLSIPTSSVQTMSE